MTAQRTRLRAGLAGMALCGLLAACGPSPIPIGPKPAADLVKTDLLNREIDAQMGGLGTCVVLDDTASGREVYRYGAPEACMAGLPPCATFDLANSLIALDDGLVTPQTVFKWDGRPQPVSAWQADADLAKAWRDQIGWWFQKIGPQVGRDRYVGALRAFDYGDHNLAGPIGAFWQGPQAGGGLRITTDQQVAFVRRFYAGRLPVSPASLAYVQGLTADETRNDPATGVAMISGRTGSCATATDGSRNVGWWIGRLKSSKRDLVFAASLEGPEAPPGLEVERRLKAIFADAGLWPAG